jgi:taurine---2-oxoglutarate transaminase
MPDMFTFAKGVTSAYIPLSGVGVSQEIFDHFKVNPLGIGSTYSGHPVSMAAGYATLKYNLEIDLVGHVKNVAGPVMDEECAKLTAKHPSIKAYRSYGLGAGVDLADKHGNFLTEMHVASAGLDMLRTNLRNDGLITFARGHHMHFCPPLIITPDEIREAFEILDRNFTKLDEWILQQP